MGSNPAGGATDRLSPLNGDQNVNSQPSRRTREQATRFAGAAHSGMMSSASASLAQATRVSQTT